MPTPSQGRVVVEVRAAGINPGEAAIRTGALKDMFPTTFPSGEGSDFSGVIVAVGEGVTQFRIGQEVLGWSDERASHATHVSAPVNQLVPKPPSLSWEVAGSLYVAGLAAWASVESVQARRGETVVVSGASGGVGAIAVQLLILKGAKVIAIASKKNHAWLRALGAVPVVHDGQTLEHVRGAASGGVQAWVDVFGGGYVKLAVELGVARARINTIIDFQAAKEFGVRIQGTQSAANAETLGQLVKLIAEGKVEVTIAARYPLDQVREAFAELEKRQARGKIVLVN